MPRKSMAIRLEAATRRRLTAVARRRGRTSSDLARTAIESFLADEEGSAGRRPFEAIADLVGCVQGGDPGRSTRGARVIARALEARGRAAPGAKSRPRRRA